ncbi:GDSL esterase/lipase EXL3 [Lactuca sativa]|uniref:GDSL esterase/lipase EXL3 n=1 Tax=Lactuca sativa TaxID=4236 RepID=UPI000CB2EF6E|nr:GDSL esterase/lipase EXL3 [Lactuca sativa]
MQPVTFMKLTYSSLWLTIIFFSLTFFGDHGGARVTLPQNVVVPAVIAFGDSIVDQGANNNLNTLIKANFSPYGKDFVGGKPTGRFTNNRTPADMIAEELGVKEILPAFDDLSLNDKELLSGLSFASGGSGYDPETPKLVGVLSMADQLNNFKGYIEKLKGIVGEERTRFILANSLFIVVASSNDLANTYFTLGVRKLHYDISSYTDLMVSSASNFIQDIYNLGSRRIAVFGAPPLGCLPAQRTLNGGDLRVCAEDQNNAAQLYNNKLQPEVEYLNRTHLESRIVYIDIYNPLLDIMQHPGQYGLEVVDKGCCGTGNLEAAILCNRFLPTCVDPSKYLFWDSYHPTDKGYNILMNQVVGKYVNDFF